MENVTETSGTPGTAETATGAATEAVTGAVPGPATEPTTGSTTEPATEPQANAPAEAPGTVEQVIQRMREIDGSLDGRDGVRSFNHMYLRVTELVAQHIQQGTFQDPEFLERMDVLFAGLYFKAVDAGASGGDVPTPWKPLFDARENRTIWPIQFALAGMNAHINHDLPVAVVETCKERGTTPGTDPVHADYLRVNDLLAKVESEVRAEFETKLIHLATEDAEALKHAVSAFTIARGRDAAWGTARTLWSQRNNPLAYRATLETVAQSVAQLSRFTILVPVVPPPPE